MWNRAELKLKARTAFKKNYWPCVLVSIILTLLITGTVGCAGSGSWEQMTQKMTTYQLTSSQIMALVITGFSASTLMIAIAVAINIFVTNPLTVGGCHFFVKNSEDGQAGLDNLGVVYRDGRFGNVFVTMLLTDLFLLLWSLLFIIPGIVKSYSYRMVPYLLADHPEMSATEVITKSREMMKGHKWKAFVLDLSFILWDILTLITFGLVGIFYVFPYMEAANAELYRALKQ